MDIRSGLDGLKALLGAATAAAPGSSQSRAARQPESSPVNSDSATVSSAGTEMAHATVESVIRADKVAEVKAALEAGTYQVPSSAIATKVIDSMLGPKH